MSLPTSTATSATPQHLTPPCQTPETPSPATHSPIATPASSRPSSIYSAHGRGNGRVAPPNSVSGLAPYGAFSKGVDGSDLKYISADYEHIWKNPTTTPKTCSPHSSPRPSPSRGSADKFDLDTIPEALESSPTPRYYTPSKYSRTATVVSKSSTSSDCEGACFLKLKASKSVQPSNRNVEFITSSGVLEYSMWDMDAREVMRDALKRAKQLAEDKHKHYPQESVQQYYDQFVAQALSDPDLEIKFTLHEDRKPDLTPTDMKNMEARLEGLAKTVSQLQTENSQIKKEMAGMKNEPGAPTEADKDKESKKEES